ncbi:GAF domain-containing protein [Mycobacterium antarcticum]|nr:GAF domain-containing protein [Mycolicibacterium sp. TUM20985]
MVVFGMDITDPQGTRARFLTAVNRLEAAGGSPAQLCAACVRTLPVQRASIAVHVDGSGLEVMCASDGVAERIEWTQITLGEGPGVDAVAAGGPMMVADLAESPGRWPTFAAEAIGCGVRAMYALPLEVGAIRVGVLTLYRDTPGALSTKEFADAVAVADLVTAILLTVGRSGRITESLGPWWDQPLSTREVHQATGMIVAQLGVTAHEAYLRMQGFSYARGLTLSEAAHAVVDRRLRFDRDSDVDPEEVADRL